MLYELYVETEGNICAASQKLIQYSFEGFVLGLMHSMCHSHFECQTCKKVSKLQMFCIQNIAA